MEAASRIAHRVVKDVTELREAERRRDELERQLMHSQKLEALGTLAGAWRTTSTNTLVPSGAVETGPRRTAPKPAPYVATSKRSFAPASAPAILVKQILAFSRKQDIVKQVSI